MAQQPHTWAVHASDVPGDASTMYAGLYIDTKGGRWNAERKPGAPHSAWKAHTLSYREGDKPFVEISAPTRAELTTAIEAYSKSHDRYVDRSLMLVCGAAGAMAVGGAIVAYRAPAGSTERSVAIGVGAAPVVAIGSGYLIARLIGAVLKAAIKSAKSG